MVCERPESRDDWVTLSSCFSSALDLDSLADDWSRRLGPESDLIPELRLRDLVASKTSGVFRGGLQLDDVVVEAPREEPGLVRLQASVQRLSETRARRLSRRP